jgi:hypothetical protein
VHNRNAAAIQIRLSPEAKWALDAFGHMCDNNIRQAEDDESIRQIWNRAHLKAIRVAGVLAASDNHVVPVMTREHAEWAIALVKTDANSMKKKVQGGDIGKTDASRFNKLLLILKNYLTNKVPPSYEVDSRMVADGIVPRKYLQMRTYQVRCFQGYRLGAALALDHTIKAAIDSGYIMEVKGEKAIDLYGYHGRCFRVLDIGR